MVVIGAFGMLAMILAYGLVSLVVVAVAMVAHLRLDPRTPVTLAALAAVVACALAPVACAAIHTAIAFSGGADLAHARFDLETRAGTQHVELLPWTFPACWLLSFAAESMGFRAAARRRSPALTGTASTA